MTLELVSDLIQEALLEQSVLSEEESRVERNGSGIWSVGKAGRDRRQKWGCMYGYHPVLL